MTINQIIEEYRKRRFASDLVEITLTQQSSGDPLILKGPGAVRQTEDGGLELKCYASLAPERHGFELFDLQTNRLSGELFGNDDYFSVEASDLDGYSWISDPVLIHNHWSMPQNAGTVTASLRLLRRTEFCRQHPQLVLIFFDQDHRYWRALTGRPHVLTMSGRSLGFAATAEQDDQIKLVIDSEQDLPPKLEDRLLEALQFVLARELHVAVSYRASTAARTLELRATSSPRPTGTSVTPLPTSSRQYECDVIALLQAYLNHIMATETERTIWHPLTVFTTLARNAGTMPLDAWSLGLCVAIEGVAGEIALAPSSDALEHKRLRKGVSDWMKAEAFSETLIRRIEGMLGQLDHVRPVDRMMSLVSSGHVFETDIKAWKSLRNRTVHTKRASDADLSDEQMQKALDEAYQALRLLYMLVFNQIGYSGHFTDLATKGWPELNYPGPQS